MSLPAPNRLAVYVAGAAALLGGLAPVIADLDWTSTAGIVAGIGAISAVLYKFIDGWSKWERQQEYLDRVPGAELPADDFDEDEATIPPEVEQAAQSEVDEQANVPTPSKGKSYRRPVKDDPQA